MIGLGRLERHALIESTAPYRIVSLLVRRMTLLVTATCYRDDLIESRIDILIHALLTLTLKSDQTYESLCPPPSRTREI